MNMKLRNTLFALMVVALASVALALNNLNLSPQLAEAGAASVTVAMNEQELLSQLNTLGILVS